MNIKKSSAVLALSFSALAFAQVTEPKAVETAPVQEEASTVAQVVEPKIETPAPLIQADGLKNVDLNLLLRGAYESPSGQTNAFRLNEARLEIRGKIIEDLEFRVRTRLNRVGADANLDRSTNNLDHAYVSYKFGGKKNWEILVGKQNNMFGSWEFDKNPTFEYQYSEAVGGYNNLFTLGARIGYSPSANHTFTLQAINPVNQEFSTTFNATNDLLSGNVASKTPFLAQLVWQGKFFNKLWNTWYSVGMSQYAKNQDNLQVFLGNKITAGNLEAYLDLGYSRFAFDHFNIANRTGNAYTAYMKSVDPLITANRVIAEDIDVKNATLRIDYKFLEKWNVTAKGFYETTSSMKNKELGNNFRTNIGYLFGLEFQPFVKHNMKFFTYFYNNDITYSNKIPNTVRPVHNNVFSIGALYVVNVF